MNLKIFVDPAAERHSRRRRSARNLELYTLVYSFHSITLLAQELGYVFNGLYALIFFFCSAIQQFVWQDYLHHVHSL